MLLLVSAYHFLRSRVMRESTVSQRAHGEQELFSRASRGNIGFRVRLFDIELGRTAFDVAL